MTVRAGRVVDGPGLYPLFLTTAGATNLLLVTFLIPISAIVLGVGLLEESLLPQHIAGMAMIAVGLASIDGRIWKSLTTKKII